MYFLTEVSENDLLNITSDTSETLPKNSAALESAIPVTDAALSNNNTGEQTDNQEDQTEEETENTEETKEPEEKPVKKDLSCVWRFCSCGNRSRILFQGGKEKERAVFR